MSETPETDAVISADTGDSGFIRNLVQLARRLERERDEARSVRDEALKEWDESMEVLDKALEDRSELRKKLTRLITERNQAREVAKLAFYIIRGVDPKFVKLAYERSVYWNGQEQPIQFMRDAIKAWDKEKKEEAK